MVGRLSNLHHLPLTCGWRSAQALPPHFELDQGQDLMLVRVEGGIGESKATAATAVTAVTVATFAPIVTAVIAAIVDAQGRGRPDASSWPHPRKLLQEDTLEMGLLLPPGEMQEAILGVELVKECAGAAAEGSEWKARDSRQPSWGGQRLLVMGELAPSVQTQHP